MAGENWDSALHGSLGRFWQSIASHYRTARNARLANIDLLSLPDYARQVVIFDRLLDAGRSKYHVRYAGLKVVDLLHMEPTGRYLDDLEFGHHTETLARAYDEVVMTGSPMLIKTPVLRGASADRQFVQQTSVVEQLACPLANARGDIAHVITAWRKKSDDTKYDCFRTTPLDGLISCYAD